ncbi:dihydrofolate reductase [Halospina denitrificans]|uniref:Dihydrofolate reductase n=1 Tax=Halospina denitrificans TaxID=332522 RepID=A0A4V3EPI7_9GAMM|nr:dihydrofolate reductase [Halospina denitrificans]TDT37858.1 dihydrofolate reductase [Halospina denitrificans]
MRTALIVAMSRNRVIGRNNALPWYLPEDLRYFKQVTYGKPIIMGRKTQESIGRPLPGRQNLVVTRDPHWQRDGVTVVNSLDEALSRAEAQAYIDGGEERVVIGGSQIYAEALPVADRLYMTEVHAEVEGDTFFPEVDWDQWHEIAREDHPASENNPFPYSLVTYDRAGSQ